jgi:flagellin-like protein
LTRIRNVRQTTKFKRSIKAISPVIATLLMIAIAVVASLVVYAWVTGYMGNTTSKAGKAIQIQSYAISGGNLLVYVQNVGQGDVALNKDQSVYIDSKLVPITLPDTATIPINAQDTVQLTLPLPSDYVQGHSLNIKVTTTDGTFMTANGIPKTTNPATTYAVNFVLGTGGLSMNPTGPQTVGGTIAIMATENNGYHFTSWSSSTGSITFGDANLASTSATINAAGTVTANFAVDTVQYSVTFAMSGDAGATISPTAGPHSYDAGSSVPITATASSGYHFTSWSSSTGSITFGDANLASTSATINAVGTITANFAVDAPQTVAITITSSTTGAGFVTVDSIAYTTPHTFDWSPSELHTIAAISPVTSGSTRYVYTGWSDSGAQSHSYTVPSSSATVTANYKTQYQITFDTSANVKGDSSVTIVTVGGVAKTGAQLPYTDYFDAGQLTYSYSSPIASSGSSATTRYLWSSTSGLSQTLQTNTFTVSGTGTILATYNTQMFEIDTSNIGSSATSTSVAVTLSNCKAGDVIIVLGSSNGDLVSSVSDNLATHLTWTNRDTVSATGHQRISEYYAVFNVGGSITITVGFPTGATQNNVVAFAISGANTAAPFDPNSGLPYSSTGSTTNTPSVTGVTTTNQYDMIIGLTGSRTTTTQTAGSSYTLIQSVTSTAGSAAAEYRIVSATQSSATVSFGTSTGGTTWAMNVDAVRRGW